MTSAHNQKSQDNDKARSKTEIANSLRADKALSIESENANMVTVIKKELNTSLSDADVSITEECAREEESQRSSQTNSAQATSAQMNCPGENTVERAQENVSSNEVAVEDIKIEMTDEEILNHLDELESICLQSPSFVMQDDFEPEGKVDLCLDSVEDDDMEPLRLPPLDDDDIMEVKKDEDEKEKTMEVIEVEDDEESVQDVAGSVKDIEDAKVDDLEESDPKSELKWTPDDYYEKVNFIFE